MVALNFFLLLKRTQFRWRVPFFFGRRFPPSTYPASLDSKNQYRGAQIGPKFRKTECWIE